MTPTELNRRAQNLSNLGWHSYTLSSIVLGVGVLNAFVVTMYTINALQDIKSGKYFRDPNVPNGLKGLAINIASTLSALLICRGLFKDGQRRFHERDSLLVRHQVADFSGA